MIMIALKSIYVDVVNGFAALLMGKIFSSSGHELFDTVSSTCTCELVLHKYSFSPEKFALWNCRER